MSHRKIKLIVLAAAAGVGLAGLLQHLDQRLSARLGGRPVGNAETAAGRADSDRTGGPDRIAVLSSAGVELLFALGAGDRIAGVTRYAVYPREVASLPKLGGVMDLNFERLTALNPDLIVAQSARPKIEAFAKKRGIPFIRIEMERIDDLLHMSETLGETLGLGREGRALSDRIRRDLDGVRRRVEGRPKVSCFISVDRTPGQLSQILSSGRETFLSELVELAGGRNVFDDMKTRYRTVSKESLMAKAPEVILEFKPGDSATAADRAALIGDWRTLDGVPAVRRNRIHVLTHDAALLPGPRVNEVAEILARTLHPAAFEEE